MHFYLLFQEKPFYPDPGIMQKSSPENTNFFVKETFVTRYCYFHRVLSEAMDKQVQNHLLGSRLVSSTKQAHTSTILPSHDLPIRQSFLTLAR